MDRFTKHLDTAEETSYHTLHGHVFRRLRVRQFTVYLEVLVLAIMCYQYGQMNHNVLFFAFFLQEIVITSTLQSLAGNITKVIGDTATWLQTNSRVISGYTM